MPEPILVVEYEPRYTERVRQALSGKPWEPQFARDGEEALKTLESLRPRLIVLSSVTPKVPTAELIRRIRGNQALAATPILLTVSGYNGTNPAADAARAGATDILPKPYGESDFVDKVEKMLAAGAQQPPAPTAQAAAAAARRKSQSDDVDKLLADTLSGMLPKKTFSGTTRTPEARKPPADDFERMLEQTLSGLEKKRPETPAAEAPPAPVKPAEPEPDPFPEASEPAATVQFPMATLRPAAPLSVAAEPAAETQEDEPQDGTRFGQFVLQERIAAGGMAEVWKARMRGVEGFQKTVAIKKILPHLSDNEEFVEMFIDEAKLAAQLSHNNIIHIYDLGKANSSYFIAMEYVDGHDLRSILRRADERGQPMPVELGLFIASKVASALDYAHRRKDFDEKDLGLVHRDVSPQNVLISYEGDIKLCDFGIAKAASKASHTQAGALKGKLQYMSPEQAWGRPLDRRSDVFALGAVLFEMLTGRKLFTGDSEMSVLEQVREARIPAIADLNEESTPQIDSIVHRALMKNPEDRYQSGGEMARDLDQILYGFRPTPTSADLAIFMHRLYSDEEPAIAPVPVPARAPEIREQTRPKFESLTGPAILEIPAETPAPTPEPEPVVAPVPVPLAVPEPSRVAAPPSAHTETPVFAAAAAHDETPRRKGLWIGIAAVLLLAAGAGAYMMTRGGSPEPAPTAQQAAVATALPVDLPPVTPPPSEEQIAAAVAADMQTTDQAAIEQEVQRRLEEARAQFEQQRQAQQAEQQRRLEEARRQQAETPARTTTTAAAVAQPDPPAPTPARETPPATTTVAERAEPPVTTTTTPRETPAQTQTTAPQVAQQAPAAPQTREGDLVPAGTPGLSGPEVLRMREPSYPPMARSRRLEGTVVLNVLISETGQVLDARVLRGITPDLGFSNSALEAIRGSTFRPAMKDGVRVRTYKTISVNFKL